MDSSIRTFSKSEFTSLKRVPRETVEFVVDRFIRLRGGDFDNGSR